MIKHNKTLATLLAACLAVGTLFGCGSTKEKETVQKEEVQTDAKEDAKDTSEDAEIYVFIAASLSNAMDQIKADYEKAHPNVTITYNKDSSGTLMSQIEEGAACDVFFSAAQGKMDKLAEDGLIDEKSRVDLVGNTLILIKGKEAASDVTGLDTLNKAKSMALADGTVPVGKYTRIALIKSGLLKSDKADPSEISTQEVSEALGGIEISEQSNVSKVLTSVIEGSCEVGTVYYSGTYGATDKIDVIEEISHDKTGPIVYPAALVKDEEATDAEKAAAKDFLDYLKGDEAKKVFDEYLFDTDLK